MDGKYLNKLLGLGAKHALYHKDGTWYHPLRTFPGVLFDKSGYVLFTKQEDFTDHPLLSQNKDVHVIGGLQSTSEYRYFSKSELELIEASENQKLAIDLNNDDYVMTTRIINSRLRKKSLSIYLKTLYNDKCQLCGDRIKVGRDKTYSEVHHIIPLGKPFFGKDQISNMICVCPNHHVLLDYRAIPLHLNELIFLDHSISEKSIEFHNKMMIDVQLKSR